MTTPRNRLYQILDDLIHSKAKRTIDGYQLSLNEIQGWSDEIVKCMFEMKDRSLEPFFDLGPNSDFCTIILRLLHNPWDEEQARYESERDLTQVIKNTLYEHYKPELEEILNDRLSIVESEERHDMGFYKSQDQETGALEWRRW